MTLDSESYLKRIAQALEKMEENSAVEKKMAKWILLKDSFGKSIYVEQGSNTFYHFKTHGYVEALNE